MSAIISDYKNSIYSRNYSNDTKAPAKTDLVKRVALAAIPFLSLHRSLRFPISIAMGTLRLWNTNEKNILGAVVTIIALAGAIFQHQVGMIVTTLHDTAIEIYNIKNATSKEAVAKSLVRIVSNLIYLALISRGGLELAIIAGVMQAVVNLIQSIDEYKAERWIEMVANLLMAGVRLQQSHTHYQQLKRNWEIEAAIKRVHVGLLHEKWRFPSDHLPVGVEVNGVKMISWNVLNNAYMEWVTEKDSQGLNGSMISELNVVVNANGLTQRDIVVAEMVQAMMAQGQVVALQECGQPFLEHLQEKLPSDWGIVKSFDSPQIDQDVILYNKTQLNYQPGLSETNVHVYPSVPGRPVQNAYFSHVGGDLRVVNVHIPGDPTLPAREEFARYVQRQHREEATTIVLGDNNFQRHEMSDAYQKAGFSEFSLHGLWHTNVFDEKSKMIDPIFVEGDSYYSRDLKPNEILPGYQNFEESINQLKGNG